MIDFLRYQLAQEKVKRLKAERGAASAYLLLAEVEMRRAEIASQVEPLKTFTEEAKTVEEVARKTARYVFCGRKDNVGAASGEEGTAAAPSLQPGQDSCDV